MGLIEIRDYLNLQEAFMSWKATATLQDSKISILDSKDVNEERLRDVAHMVKQLGIDTPAIASDKIRNDVALFASVAKEVLDIDIYSPNNKTNTNVDYDWGGISSDVDGDWDTSANASLPYYQILFGGKGALIVGNIGREKGLNWNK